MGMAHRIRIDRLLVERGLFESRTQAQSAIAEVLHKKLPAGMTFEWTELAYQEILSGNTMALVFPLCVHLAVRPF